ncbi:hypothetical protein KIW84_022082 [Lathyrus oleraceus]|uniref:Gag-pol polyprotein n=1 Tax=Pisum sativum TaxID=3888 RepID=A0A9D4YBM6_PEA|nr:hypothetical protein KIW84_022082 [Pisum sativum]
MIASAPSDFTEMVNMGMRLEEGVREGRLSLDDNSSAKKYGGFARKKEGETHAVSSHSKRRPYVRRKEVRPVINQHQVAHIAPVFRETQQPQQQSRPQQQAYQPCSNNNNNITSNYERKRVTFDPIPMSHAELYPSLIDKKLVTPRDPPIVPANPQWWYKHELHCVYHSGAPEHDVENCFPLKTKVQDLVRSHIHIVFILLDEGFTKIIEGTDVCTIQTHIPSQCSTGQTVLEIMNQQLIIIRLSRHFPGIHNQVSSHREPNTVQQQIC